MVRSGLCDYIYIFVKEAIDLSAAVARENDKAQKGVALEYNAIFRSCISKINNTLTDNAEDFDIVMLIYNLLESSDNYPMTSESLTNYCSWY